MSEPFIGEIRMFAGDFAPAQWAFCDNSIVSAGQNEALFSLLGAAYGGDGRTTFALPDLRGRIPVHQGQGPGLSEYRLGTRGGSETVTLEASAMPSHQHAMQASLSPATTASPAGGVLADPSPTVLYSDGSDPTRITTLSPNAIQTAGGAAAHDNMMPFLAVNFIIALTGTYPQRS